MDAGSGLGFLRVYKEFLTNLREFFYRCLAGFLGRRIKGIGDVSGFIGEE
jgi:hypothetical protein